MTEALSPEPAGRGPAPGAQARLAVAADHHRRVNFAMQQNGVVIVERVTVTNTGDAPAVDVAVRIRLANDVAEPWAATIARIEPGQSYNLSPVGLAISPRLLAAQTEREATELIVEASAAGATAVAALPVEVLAFNEWGGAGALPELLAAFATPNHPCMTPLLLRAREILAAATGSDAVDGYQSMSRRRAANIGEAVYRAVRERDIGYINPPASFETGGQRVRLADEVLETRLGTCLDLSLALAGAWEQAGLHPLVIVFDGHALPALWTVDEHFADAVIDSVIPVRKRIDLEEIIPVESTLLTGAGASFADAVERAKQRLRDAGGEACVVDIRAARKRRVRPLPQRTALADAAAAAGSDAAANDAFTEALFEAGEAAPADHSPTDALRPRDRIDRWKRKLLDLSLRNRLINLRDTKRVIPLLCADIAALEDALADGAALDVRPRSQGVERSAERAAVAGDIAESFLREELASHRVYTDLSEKETLARLVEVYRDARSGVEETGANLLHLALGTLEWRESPDSEQPRRAPLVLLPVRLERHAAGQKFTLALTDEPAKPNVTLLEKLRSEFGVEAAGLEELPEDESGIDVQLILRRFREAVKPINRWEVKETAHLGLFSFNKFLMWRDLEERTDDLRQSRLVRRLVDRHGEPADDRPFPSADSLDDDTAPGELLCPRDADSSQLAAIKAAGEGRTYVLEGPPGTGKSQTITNIIADALGRGKRVLFVAEKMAALTVVRRRLEQDGLGPFCLELHSNKAAKKEVLAQLRAALDCVSARELEAWQATCDQLGESRARINEYIRELHHPRATGESIFQVIARRAHLGDGPRAPLAIGDPLHTDAQTLAALRDRTDRLAAAAGYVGDPAAHPLRAVGVTEFSFALPDKARSAIDAVRPRLDEFARRVDAWWSAAVGDCAAASEALSGQGLSWTQDASRLLLDCPRPPRELLTETPWAPLRDALRTLIDRGRARDALRDQLLRTYRPELLSRDTLVMLDGLRRAHQKPALLRWFAERAARKAIRPYALDKLPDTDTLITDLERVLEAKRETEALASPQCEGARCFARLWAGGEADWDALSAMLDWTDRFRALLDKAPSTGSANADAVRAALADLAADAAARLTESAEAARASRALLECAERLVAARTELERLLHADPDEAWGPDDAPGRIASDRAVLDRWAAGLGSLQDWCHWRAARTESLDRLAGLIDALERGACAASDLRALFERSFADAWLPPVADSVESIRSFSARKHADEIDRFRTLDERVIRMTSDLLRARLAAGVPRARQTSVGDSEMGILLREIEKQRRHMPIRQLVQKLPHLLPMLKPCFLMSPLSVAQYLDPAQPPFDLVVFDEASQIPVWDAVGAIARGAEVIVVGDSKQLPPTNFFNKLEGADDGDEFVTDDEELESILQECRASGVRDLRLRWHYRSRHESLITFSNYHYYDNQLLTFPSAQAEAEDLGVSLRYLPDAVYDRGASGTNRAEAEAIADEVVRILTRPRHGPPPTIGVVTFNIAQQRLIEDLLDERRRADPALEPHFSNDDEPVFVKNLENVQGDERDVILFSIAYGPDAQRRVTMNFGPLNRDGGERRLNVAITRSRKRVVVFSSIRADDIDLSRTSAVAVRHLKTFLDYAARGAAAIGEATAPTAHADFDSPFENAVHRALTARGWDVDAQIGCSGYRIDLAVKDPDAPGRYLLGVECDGAAYHSSRTARDRDRLRQSVLENLGWRLHRVWSTDWFANQQGCIDSIKLAIDSARRARAAAPADPPEPEPAMQEPAPDAETTPGGGVGIGIGAHAEAAADAPAAPPAPPVYVAMDTSRPVGERDEFFEPRATSMAVRALAAIVDFESPITAALAGRRLAALWGAERMTQRVSDRFEEILRVALRNNSVRLDTTGALWSAQREVGRIETYRVPGDDPDTQRDIEEIPLAERAAALAEALAELISAPRESLEAEGARRLGAQRVTQRIREAMAEGVDELLQTQRARLVDGRVAIP